MAITRDDVKYVAKLSRLELTEDEEALFCSQLADILEYVDQLQEVDIEGVEPYISAAGEANVLREDVKKESLPREKALQNAPEQGDDGFVVPKVVDNPSS
ncbi:MAG: Asp-tRNA(Asn)/Glu-tRNA(Gln) amidotransferase subunit GatC [Planctomycetota bacterium]|jgi:aspartyl-tRNA(Asn)/glutamyl-tRNA(Gln) amidotransferase subunit C